MITKCGSCGAPQKNNNTKICEFCGGSLVSSDINEKTVDEFLLIKYDFLKGEFRKVINKSEEYLKKDNHNIPLWAFKIISEFLKDDLDFKELKKSLKILLDLKITNDISKSIIENMIIDILRCVIPNGTKKDKNYKKNEKEFSVSILLDEWRNIHESRLRYQNQEIEDYFEFIEYSIEHFSKNYRIQLCEIYTIYFSSLNLKVQNEHDIVESFTFFNYNYSYCSYSIIKLQKIITPFDQYTKNLLNSYFDYIINSLNGFTKFKNIEKYKELLGIEISSNKRNYIFNFEKLKANLEYEKEIIKNAIDENSQEIDDYLNKQILKSEILIEDISKKVYYQNRWLALSRYEIYNALRANIIAILFIGLFFWVGFKYVPYVNVDKWTIYFHLLKFSLACIGIFHFFSYLYKYISKSFINKPSKTVEAKRNLTILRVFIGLSFLGAFFYFITNFTSSNSMKPNFSNNSVKAQKIIKNKWSRSYYNQNGTLMKSIKPDILEFTSDSLVYRRKKLNDKKYNKGRWHYDENNNLIIDFGDGNKSSIFERNDTLFGKNQNDANFYCVPVN